MFRPGLFNMGLGLMTVLTLAVINYFCYKIPKNDD
jgi:hypothetical protein